MNLPSGLIGIVVVSIAIGTIFSLHMLRNQQRTLVKAENFDLPQPLPRGGIRLPVSATYSSIKGLGSFCVFQSKSCPKLNLHNNHLGYQVLKTKSAELNGFTEHSTLMITKCRACSAIVARP